jgi:hypothetical protein
MLVYSPGLALFSALSGPSVRGIILIKGHCYAVSGTTLYEVFTDGSSIARGQVGSDGNLVSMAASQIHMCVVSAGTLYVLTIGTNQFQKILNDNNGNPLGTIGQVDYSDGFFLILLANSQQINISAPEDPTNWIATQFIVVSEFPDNVIAFKVDHRQPFLLGPKASVAYYLSGGPNIYDPIPGGFIENGIIAPASLTKLDNTLFWIDQDDRGQGIVRRLNGYTPVRVSNFAVEFAMQSYAKISDAVGYSYQDQGHSFLVLYFPTPSKTWVYDVATGLWHERQFLNPNTGQTMAHRSQCHAFAFGRHLVGDWQTGNIFDMNISYLTDFGNSIQRIRRSPAVSKENEWLRHHSLEVDVETGLGPQPPLLDPAGNPRGPLLNLRFSDDGAKTWSNLQPRDCGQAGKFKTRVIWRRLGRSRQRVYELSASDAVPWRVVDAYLKATPDYEPTERIVKSYGKAT